MDLHLVSSIHGNNFYILKILFRPEREADRNVEKNYEINIVIDLALIIIFIQANIFHLNNY